MWSRVKGVKLLSWVVITASLAPGPVISQDVCRAGGVCNLVSNGSVCEFDFEAVPGMEAEDPCCASECFGDAFVFSNFQKDSLSLSVDYRARDKATLTIQWEYANLTSCPPGTVLPGPDPPSPVRITFTQNGMKRCLCLPPVKVLDPYDGYGYPQACGDSFVSYMTHQKSVGGCWSELGQQSLQICGKQVPSPPVAVTALAGDMQLTTNLIVQWAPPKLHNSPIAVYIIDVFERNDGGHVATTTVSGNATQYTFEFDKALREEDNPFIMIAAGVYTNDIGLCRGGDVEGRKVVFSNSTHAPVQWPNCSDCAGSTNEPFPEVHAIVWPSIGAVFLLTTAVTILIFFVVKRTRRPASLPIIGQMEKGFFGETPRLTRSVSSASSIHEEGTVFLAASTEEDEGVKRRTRHLCHVLADHGLTPVYYEYVVNDHTADSPAALGMNQWVELQFSRCQFVLFVCTKRFLEEWNGERKGILSPLVYPCRNLLDGLLTQPQNISRYAILFMGEDRCVPTVLKNFKQFELFGADSDNIYADRLVCYLLETPPYAMPQVANCVPLKQFL